MYTVVMREWANNWSSYGDDEEYSSFDEAKERADYCFSFTIYSPSQNSYIFNGTESYVVDNKGKVLYRPEDPETEIGYEI